MKKILYLVGGIAFIIGVGLFISVFSKSTVEIDKNIASPEIQEDKKEEKIKDLVLTPPQFPSISIAQEEKK